jgi:tetratricopeptide (TPR) repeat protein
MRKSLPGCLLAISVAWALPLVAQTPCPSFSVVVNTPEDELTMALNGAEKPDDQIAALDKFVQAHPDSKFMPCVNEYYTSTYVKMNNFDKAIEYGEKDVAANYMDLNLAVNLLKAYVNAGKPTDAAFDLIAKAPDLIKTETAAGAKPAKATDEEWKKMQEENAEAAKQDRAFMEYAFFQLLPRVTDGKKRVQYLDSFTKSYPDSPNTGQLNFQYFMAYEMAGDVVKADDYGEKAIAADPNNIEALNLVAYDYANRRTDLDKASGYAKKVLTLVPSMKKPDGASDDQFKNQQNNWLGMAHLTLGYIDFQKAGKTRKVGTAIQELKTAGQLLGSNPALQGAALFYLGSAYEYQYPPSHRLAADALTRASSVESPWQAQARDLLAKVRAAR